MIRKLRIMGVKGKEDDKETEDNGVKGKEDDKETEDYGGQGK